MGESKDALVVFSPSGKRGRFPVGSSVLQAARELGVDIDSICGGRALCGRCRVEPVYGQFARENIVSRPDHLAPAGDSENNRLCELGSEDRSRLSCQATIEGDVRIDVPPASQVHNQVIRKDCEIHDIHVDPVLRLYYLEVDPPDIHWPEGDFQRLERALAEQWQLTGLEAGLAVVCEAQRVLREGKWKATMAVREGKEIVAAWPGLRDRVYGAAIDVGSTTIAAHLCDLCLLYTSDAADEMSVV